MHLSAAPLGRAWHIGMCVVPLGALMYALNAGHGLGSQAQGWTTAQSAASSAPSSTPGATWSLMPRAPCRMPNILVVGSSGTTDQASKFSNIGRNTVHLLAPGEQILSTTYNSWCEGPTVETAACGR